MWKSCKLFEDARAQGRNIPNDQSAVSPQQHTASKTTALLCHGHDPILLATRPILTTTAPFVPVISSVPVYGVEVGLSLVKRPEKDGIHTPRMGKHTLNPEAGDRRYE